MDIRPERTDIAQTLSADQAADMLGHSPRHVRRLIARGDLEGTRDPYRTTRAAVDAYRFKQRTGQLDTQPDQVSADVRAASEPADLADRLVDGLVSELAQTRRQLTDLAREVGRLETELAQARREAHNRGSQQRREDGARVGVWGRVGAWLRG